MKADGYNSGKNAERENERECERNEEKLMDKMGICQERKLSPGTRGKKIFFYFFNKILETKKR